LAQALQHSLDARVAFGDFRLIKVVQLNSLRESKDVLLPVVADQRLADRFDGGMTAWVAHGGQCRRVALSSHDRADDGHAGHAGDVGHHVMELQVHLRQSLLHVLDVGGGVVQQAFAQP